MWKEENSSIKREIWKGNEEAICNRKGVITDATSRRSPYYTLYTVFNKLVTKHTLIPPLLPKTTDDDDDDNPQPLYHPHTYVQNVVSLVIVIISLC